MIALKSRLVLFVFRAKFSVLIDHVLNRPHILEGKASKTDV